MIRKFTAAIAILLIVASAGCGGSDEPASPQDMYVGVWKTGNGFFSIHGEDGTWKVGPTLAVAESSPFTWGVTTFEGTTMTSVTDEGSAVCAGVTAVFEIAVSDDGDTITITSIDDPCEDVRGSDVSQITRHKA